MPATVVTEPARPTSVRARCAGTVATARPIAASMSAVAAAISASAGGSERRCRSVIRTQPMSTDSSDEHTSELQSPYELVCRLLLEKKNNNLSLLQTREAKPNAQPHHNIT